MDWARGVVRASLALGVGVRGGCGRSVERIRCRIATPGRGLARTLGVRLAVGVGLFVVSSTVFPQVLSGMVQKGYRPPAAAVAPPPVPPAPSPSPVKPRPAPAHSGFDPYATQAPKPPRLARREVRSRSQLPVGALHAFYAEQYAVARRGDADAIYQLGLVLKECKGFDATPQALQTSIARVYRTRQFSGMAVDPQWAAGELQRRYQRCEGIAADARERYYEVMTRAADRGSIEALEAMVFQMPPDDICRERELRHCDHSARRHTFDLRTNQASWLKKAQEMGSLKALWLLGAAYMNGEMFERDLRQAYIYMRAYQMVSEQFGIDVQARALIADLRQRLRPAEFAEAEASAKALMANPNCCVHLR